MIDNPEIKIKLLKGPRHAWLSLKGTVLSYRDQTWSQETNIDIPVELISIIEKKQFAGQRLIAASLWLLFSYLIVAIIIHLVQFQQHSIIDTIIILLGIGLVLVPFVVLLIYFFIRQRTVTLQIEPEKWKISFWVDKKNKTNIDLLLSELTNRKEFIKEKVPYPLHSAIGDSIRQPWKRTVILTLLCAYPVLVFHQPILLLLCIIPILMHLWNLLFLIRQPVLYSDAVRYCLNKQWDKAINSIEQLLQQSPSYIRGYLLYIQILLRLEQFDRAEKILSNIQSKLNPELVDSIYLEITNRKRLFDRKAMVV